MGVAAAQCIIFGVFGVNARPDGDVVIRPNPLPFAPRLALKGLKVRGRSLDVRIDDGRYEVRSGGQRITASTGEAVLVSTKDGSFRLVE